MVKPKVVIEGDAELRAHLMSILDGVENMNEGAGAEAARLVAERAERQAPALSGVLRDTIRTFAQKRNAGIRVGFARVPYAGPVVGGHGSASFPRAQGGFMRPNPFPYDALDQRYSAVIEVYERFIDQALDDPASIRNPQKYKRHETN